MPDDNTGAFPTDIDAFVAEMIEKRKIFKTAGRKAVQPKLVDLPVKSEDGPVTDTQRNNPRGASLSSGLAQLTPTKTTFGDEI